ncbi:MAG: Uncharacterized protein G01um101418_26 [Parcubacteria group bacterium Gr01-1014_18]|nr:MAG: Uncharacterized protein Greene041636_26 [Parcubacteria group bacterium Greene0416_36]TSC81532.1 MAG: Uncharacterized protein G01um101418_26 [Parcubacteria group bacterium Gr01-1014_18]TSC99657.1 MAG: Uncharacterized protein Greene101420_61 [Parcubacteria group bacterium Greene1014_20]TSD07108.1 MAG: Uncharacterized protein Greene07142_420 [Parcubacteria group bacterium Greene0714_2]
MQILDLKNTSQENIINHALQTLASGGLLIYPTETCYGAGVDATNPEAVAKLLEYKTKRQDKPFSVAVVDEKMAGEYVEMNETARNIYHNFLPGPVTVISKGKNKVAPGVQSIQGTLGIRIPDHPLITEIVRVFGKPVTATSANSSGQKTPYKVADIFDYLSGKQRDLIDLVLDAGELPPRAPSTVIDTTQEHLAVLRKGDRFFEDAQTFISESVEQTNAFSEIIFNEIKPFLGKKSIVILLNGQLGSGKTTFTQFLAKRLGVKESVVSPTFILCNEYEASWEGKPFQLQHLDTYRLEKPEEITILDLPAIFSAGGGSAFGGKSPNIVCIEWAERIMDVIQPYLKESLILHVFLEHVGEGKRRIRYKVNEE